MSAQDDYHDKREQDAQLMSETPPAERPFGERVQEACKEFAALFMASPSDVGGYGEALKDLATAYYEASLVSEAEFLSRRAAELAELLLLACGTYDAAKDALLKAAGMYSQATADWPDGDAHSQS